MALNNTLTLYQREGHYARGFDAAPSFAAFLLTNLLGLRLTGGGGVSPARQSKYATRSDGWAPTESQYLMRSTFILTSLAPSKV